MTTRIAKSTLSEVNFTQETIYEVNDLMMNLRVIVMTDGDQIGVEHAAIELVDVNRRHALGVIRYNTEAGLTFTPAAERVVV